VSTTIRMVRALIPTFNLTLRMCLTIAMLSIRTHAVVGTLDSTEAFGNCFGADTEDICLWGMVQKNQFGLITSLMLIVYGSVLVGAHS
jgi:hypothetical protein